MVRRGARSGVTVAVLVLLLLAGAGVASADAPRTGRIVEGRSMAGVALRIHAPRSADNMRVLSGPLAAWGRVEGFCFEGTFCSWDVRGGGRVLAILHGYSSRVQRMATTATGWRTAAGIRRGSTVNALRSAYGARAIRRDTCGLNGFGGDHRGYVLNTRHAGERRFTFFDLNPARTRVREIWIGRGRVPSGLGC